MAGKKDVTTEVPTTPTQPSQPSNVRSFFTPEINEQLAGMTVKEMENVLKEMIETRQFLAILKYTSMRMPLLDATLRSANPSTDAHKISWSQGAMAGLTDIEGYVIDLNAPAPQQQPAEEENGPIVTKPEGVVVG